MKPLYILKLGGSVITYKDRQEALIRKVLIRKIAKAIKKALDTKDFRLILIHGAGSTGHQLAHKYQLKKGAKRTKDGWRGSFLTRIANQKMNVAISEIFVKNNLSVVSVHTSSVIIQKNKLLNRFDLSAIKEAINNDCVPMLYGEMVFDKTLGMTVCSGDTIAPHLAKKLGVKKIFFASDIDGIYNKDPHVHKDAKLIEKISLKNIERKIKLTKSHNIDVSDGLLGKIRKLECIKNIPVESVEIFNGLDEKNYKKVLLGKTFKHTTIKI
jgi:isopentenyl phosphate kinase